MSKKAPLTPGQKKLSSLGGQLPLLPTSVSSSLPKHSELVELRYKVEKKVQPYSELERKEKISTEIWIRHQERMGLDILVDGEMNRGDMVSFFAKKIEGFDPGGTVRCYENRYYRKPVIRRKIEWREPITVENWRLNQRMTHKILKAVVTGPYTLMDWSFNEYYSTREAALADVTAVIKKELKLLAEAGAKIIQIEEPALSARPEEFSLVSDALKEITKGIKSYLILQHGFGDIAPIWDDLQKLPVDNISLDLANAHFASLSLLKKRKADKDITVGIVDSHIRTVESSQQVRHHCRTLLKWIPARHLWLSTESGLKTRSVDESIEKIKSLVAAAGREREKL